MSPGRLYERGKLNTELVNNGDSLLVIENPLTKPRLRIAVVSVSDGLDITVSRGSKNAYLSLRPGTSLNPSDDDFAFLKDCDIKVEGGIMCLPGSRRIEAGDKYINYRKSKGFKRRADNRW